MSPHIHYDNDHTESDAAEKSSIRTLICLATASEMPLFHIEIYSEFTAEKYTHTKPVFEKQNTRFDGSMTHPTCCTVQLILNLYGSKPASQIYFTGRKAHLIQNGYTPLQADPCTFAKRIKQYTTTDGTTTDDFLVTALNHKIIDEFKHMITRKYTVRDLGEP